MGLSITSEVSQKIRELQPLIAALNTLSGSYHVATDHYGDALDALPDDFQPHHMDECFDERIRDLAHDSQEALWHSAREIAAEYGLEIRFNRIDGQFVLLEGQDPDRRNAEAPPEKTEPHWPGINRFLASNYQYAGTLTGRFSKEEK